MSKIVLGLAAGAPAAVVLGIVGWSFASTPSAPVAYQPTVYAAPAAPPQPAPAARTGSSASARSASSVPTISASWLTRTAAKSGIPVPALQAYARAELEAPCSIGWTTLAGLGWVESHHGTIGGRTLRADGYSSKPILGPPLDGAHGLAAVRAGNGSWERAVGPLQFIPSTWATWASDGDGDGVEDPNDINDAAYAAARYLCASGQNLATGSGWAAAIYSYNHSQAYVNEVYAAATAYDQRTR